MRCQTLLLTAAAASSVCALPSLFRRDDEMTWDPNGNLKLTFSKQTVKIGTVKIDEIFEKLGEVCHESGQCETNDITIDGQLIQAGRGGDVSDITVTLGPDGEYPTWIRNGLLDSLKAAVLSMAKCEDVTNIDDCSYASAMAYCPQRTITVNECEVPQYWGINFQDPAAANAAPPNIGVGVTMDFTENKVCEDMMTALGAVAGAVHGVGGGIFTLLSFACK